MHGKTYFMVVVVVVIIIIIANSNNNNNNIDIDNSNSKKAQQLCCPVPNNHDPNIDKNNRDIISF